MTSETDEFLSHLKRLILYGRLSKGKTHKEQERLYDQIILKENRKKLLRKNVRLVKG